MRIDMRIDKYMDMGIYADICMAEPGGVAVANTLHRHAKNKFCASKHKHRSDRRLGHAVANADRRSRQAHEPSVCAGRAGTKDGQICGRAGGFFGGQCCGAGV